MIPPTHYPELNAVLQELTKGVTGILRDNLIGVYLQGSFAVGDFDQDSDVDFIVVTGGELSEAQLAGLQIMHPRLYHLESEWAKHLEGSYFPKDTLRDYRQSGGQLWYLDHGSQSLERSDHDDSVVVRWTLREHGVLLVGPNPATLIDPIPVEALRQETLRTIHRWGAEILADSEHYNNRFYQGFITLNYCRMLRDLQVGDTGSKRAGAEWAKAKLDPSWAGLIDRAWDTRPDPARSVRQRADPDDFQRTLSFVRLVMGESTKIAANLAVGGAWPSHHGGID